MNPTDLLRSHAHVARTMTEAMPDAPVVDRPRGRRWRRALAASTRSAGRALVAFGDRLDARPAHVGSCEPVVRPA